MKALWRDSRLRFQQLGNCFTLNELDSDLVWRPSFLLRDAVFKDYLAYSRSENVIIGMYAIREKSGPYIIYNGMEGKSFWYISQSYHKILLQDIVNLWQNWYDKLLNQRWNIVCFNFNCICIAQEFQGSVMLMEEFSAAYNCAFDMLLFPFGVHVCLFAIGLQDMGPLTPIFDPQV